MSELLSEQKQLRAKLLEVAKEWRGEVTGGDLRRLGPAGGVRSGDETKRAREVAAGSSAFGDLTGLPLTVEPEPGSAAEKAAVRMLSHVLKGAAAEHSLAEIAGAALRDSDLLALIEQARREEKARKLPLQVASVAAAIPMGYAAFRLAILLGTPREHFGPASWVENAYLESFLRLIAHGYRSDGFWAFLFSGPTILYVLCVAGCFLAAGALIGVVFRRCGVEWAVLGLAAAPYVVPGLALLQKMGPLKGAVGQMGREGSFFVVAVWFAVAWLAHKAGVGGAALAISLPSMRRGGALATTADVGGGAGAAAEEASRGARAAGAGRGETASRLRELGALLDGGLISQEEYEKKKAEILDDL